MLFNSFEFLFIFLPIVAVVFFLIGTRGHHSFAISWLVVASLFFYGWWNPVYLSLIAVSILFNYRVGASLAIHASEYSTRTKFLLIFGIAVNLGLLAYFKYANFFVANMNTLVSTSLHIEKIILPLAISFFTFQQIAFLVDAYRRETREYNFLHYSLFVTFFPQLIAGPIVHHKEMLPQFAKDSIYRPDIRNIAIGVSIIIIGLFKKTVIADGVALYADPVFRAAETGAAISFFEAWGGALAYTVQIYFDFSGYVDMAMGSARIFGIVLPINFNSPYKSLNIIDFWRRWHMTLSRFLRDYLYFPLGGNRKGRSRRHINLMITMLLGGLWHGAGWTFIFWGFLHGSYLVVNHAWRTVKVRLDISAIDNYRIIVVCGWFLTLMAVVVSWVFFRAESFSGAMNIVQSMFGEGFMSLPDSLSGRLGAIEPILLDAGFSFDNAIVVNLREWAWGGVPLIVFGLVIAVFLPNSNELFDPASDRQRIAWKPSIVWVVFLFTLFVAAILHLFRVSPFLYFNF